MRVNIGAQALAALVARQIDALFVLEPGERGVLDTAVGEALERTEHCFSRIRNKYYSRDGEVFFNAYHSAQYGIFLYFVARAVYERHGGTALADKAYYLNKSLNAYDLFYEVRMPAAFYCDHPVGSVLGRARYGECFAFNQNCLVGNSLDRYPTLGDHVMMLSGAKIVGASTIGHHCVLSANAYVKDEDVPPYSMVFGASPGLVVKPMDQARYEAMACFHCNSQPEAGK